MDYQSEKSFGKLRLRAFQPYHEILMLKNVEDVTDYSTFDIFDMLQSPESQLSKPFFLIENLFNIKEVMSKNVCVCSFPIFNM